MWQRVTRGEAPRTSARRPVQQRRSREAAPEAGPAPRVRFSFAEIPIHDAAERGIASPSTALPHAAAIGRAFGPRHDVAGIRAHVGAGASAACRDMNAVAFASGSHAVFAGTPDLGTAAHEAAHVIQQAHGVSLDGGVGAAGDRYEQHADRVADRVVRGESAASLLDTLPGGAPSATPAVQRRLVVDPNAPVTPPLLPLTSRVQNLINDICPSANAKVDPTTGEATLPTAFFEVGLCDWAGVPYRSEIRNAELTATPVGCGCICDVINNTKTTTVSFRAGGPGTTPPSQVGAGPGHDGARTDAGVLIDPSFQGQYLINGKWTDVPFHLLFAHELCGHALPKMEGTHAHRGATPAGGTPPQERHAVDVERDIAAEGGFPRRPEDYSGAARQRP